MSPIRTALLGCLLLTLRAGTVPAAVYGGMWVDTSSNMLMQPEGEQGTSSGVYGGAGFVLGRANISWQSSAGTIEHYPGIQFHRHTVDVSWLAAGNDRSETVLDAYGTIARYGDVTVLDGYVEGGGAVSTRWYVTDATLLRSSLVLSRRAYRDFPTENRQEADVMLRIDRFFDTGTTLRGQFDAGARRHDGIGGTPVLRLVSFTVRGAQSVGSRWGIWLEGRVSDAAGNAVPEDSLQVFERLFFDDQYQYSRKGVTANIKRLIGNGFAQFTASRTRRAYDAAHSASFWYLPADGWDEDEWSCSLTISWQPRFLPAVLHPSLVAYYLDVNASAPELSFGAGGVSFKLDVY